MPVGGRTEWVAVERKHVANAPSRYGSRPEDGWGPATPVQSSGGGTPGASAGGSGALERGSADGGGPAARGGASGSPQYGSPKTGRLGATSAWDRLAAVGKPVDAGHERGLPGWAALLVLIGIAAVGGLIDMISGTHVRGGVNIGIVVASIVAILVVRRSGMFPVVVAPPIVYSVASGLMLYISSNGLDDRKVLIDSAANWLVYGFPAVAAATAAVLIIAGIRLITRR